MSQSFGKSKTKKVKIMEDMFGKKDRAQKSKKAETKVETHVKPFVRAYVSEKKFITKAKSLMKRYAQTLDSDSDAEED